MMTSQQHHHVTLVPNKLCFHRFILLATGTRFDVSMEPRPIPGEREMADRGKVKLTQTNSTSREKRESC